MAARPRYTAALAVALALFVLPLGAGAQTDGVKETSNSTFELRPDEGRVHADIRITLVNQKKTPLRWWGPVWTPAAAENVVFGGKGVTTETVSDGPSVTDTLNFPALKRKQKQQISVGYDLVHDEFGGPGRTVIADDYARFCWGGEQTDSGRVRAILPPGWQAVSDTSDTRVRMDRERTIITPVSDEPPGTFFACTDAFETSLGSRVYILGPSDQIITLDSWTDDPDWEPAMSQVIGRQLRVLERLIGSPMPVAELTIQEVSRSDPRGSAADFLPAADLLLGGQRVDVPGTATIALARTWFNEGTIADAWLAEGLASWSGLTAEGLTCPTFDRPVDADSDAPGLGLWRTRAGRPSEWDEARYAFQSASACTIVEAVATALGRRAMTDVTSSLLASGRPADLAAWLAAIAAAAPSPQDDAEGETPLELALRLHDEFGVAQREPVAIS